jgi:hypothetical protein
VTGVFQASRSLLLWPRGRLGPALKPAFEERALLEQVGACAKSRVGRWHAAVPRKQMFNSEKNTHVPCSAMTTPVPIDSILQLLLRVLANVPEAAIQFKNADGK